MMEFHKFLFSLVLISYDAMASEPVAQIFYGNTNFSNDLYNILSRNEGNLLFSPFSLHATLSLMHQGAVGSTAKKFENVLYLSDTETTAEGYQNLMEQLSSVKNVKLNIANKLFVQQGYKLKKKFTAVVKEDFLSEVENVNFAANTATAEHINNWVENKTNDKIKDIIRPNDLNALTRLVSVNAIYFLGNWLKQFNPNLTKKQKFYFSDNDTVECEMMRTRAFLKYNEDRDLDAQILSIPYKSWNFSMIIIVPRSKTGLKDLERKLQTKSLTNLRRDLRPSNIRLLLPKFKIKKTIDLKDTLTELGLGPIFSGPADFSKMIASAEDITVSKVVQKVFIEVNEVGTEAAVVTGGVKLSKSGPLKSLPLVADRPFIFSIIYKQNDILLPLFVGRMAKP